MRRERKSGCRLRRGVKRVPAAKAGLFASCVALVTRLRYEECGCRAPSLARKDGFGSSAE